MWRIPTLARPEVWLCLLGSLLALVAFFLPHYNPLPGSLSHGPVLLVSSQPSVGVGLVVFLAIGTLLLLLGIVVLAILALFLRSPRWNITETYLSLTIATLMYYFVAAPVAIFFDWLGALISGTLPIALGIGVWLLPVGLLLALVGGILLERRQTRASG